MGEAGYKRVNAFYRIEQMKAVYQEIYKGVFGSSRRLEWTEEPFSIRKIIISGAERIHGWNRCKTDTTYIRKNTLTTDIIGIGYSTVVTIAPMLVGDRCTCTYGILSGFFLCGLYYKGTVFLYGAVYLHFRTADGIAVQLGAVKIHVGCDL